MPNNKILLQPSKIYHIYNRGINSTDLFFENDNYEHFLRLYDKYIDPVADTFAWVLLKNHFHLLVKINSIPNLEGFESLQGLKNLPPEKRIYQQFSNLFNSYTKAINKRHKRTGALFESNFHRKLIDNKKYFKNMIVYINNNPVHHGFCEHALEYPWSSYLSTISFKPTKAKRKEVIGWFNNVANFKTTHDKSVNFHEIDEWLKI